MVFGLCNAGEALLTAWLIEHYFGLDFNLGKLSRVLGMLVCAIVATAVSGIGGTAGFLYFHTSNAPISDCLAALVRFRCPWNHHGRTANH